MEIRKLTQKEIEANFAQAKKEFVQEHGKKDLLLIEDDVINQAIKESKMYNKS